MNEFLGFDDRKRKRNLFVVEGDHEKDFLINNIIEAFPELDIDSDLIEVFHSNIYNLYTKLEGYYGEDMRFHHDPHNLDVDLPNILLSEEGNNIHKRDFQKIYLFFDYERQDTFYSSDKIDKMMHIFNDETNNGKLYINYPMVEAYMDMDCWADEEYLTKSISASISNGKLYKSEVISKWVYYDINICNKIFDKVKMCLKGVERELRKVAALEATDSILSLNVEGNAYWKGVYNILYRFIAEHGSDEKIIKQVSYEIQAIIRKCKHLIDGESYHDYLRRLFAMLVRKNLEKSIKLADIKIADEKLSLEELIENGYEKILHKQNQESQDRNNGKIYVVNTCILLIAEFDMKLIS